MLFLPARRGAEATCRRAVARGGGREGGRRFLGWRDVPVDPTHLGPGGAPHLPEIAQCFVARAARSTPEAFERQLFRVRQPRRGAVRRLGSAGRGAFYVVSLSSRTIVYKGLLLPTSSRGLLPDLADPETESAIALVHSRFSTNTFPTWALRAPVPPIWRTTARSTRCAAT